ncbi:MAG: hypothetical protein AAFX06_20435 [Planctomycetota bacterium]
MPHPLPTPLESAPSKLSLRDWLAIAIFLVLLLAATEQLLRGSGYESGPHDDDAFWAFHRLAADNLERDGVVCIGSSRCQADVRIKQLSDAISRPVVQLSIAGSSPLPVLEDLATHSTFRGTVVLSISPHHAFSRRLDRTGKSQDWIKRYHEIKSSPGERMELKLKIGARNSVLLRQDFNWRTVLNRYVLRREPAYKEVFTKETRWKHFPDVMKGARSGFQLDIPESDRDLESRDTLIERYAAAIRIIEQRGGKVLIIRPPSTGYDCEDAGFIDTEKRSFPRHAFYDRLVQHCDVPDFHAEDVPTLKDLRGVDGSHLCNSDAKRFTQRLALVIPDRE